MQFTNLPSDLVEIPKDPKWVVQVDQIINRLKGRLPMREAFTTFWNSLGSNWRSLIISFLGLVIGTLVFLGIKLVFPEADVMVLGGVLLGAASTFIGHLLKESGLTE